MAPAGLASGGMARKLLPCLLALALSSAAEARAQPAADVNKARDLFVEGSKLAESGDWEAARDRFERSLKLKRAALTLYNLGIAQQETGHLAAAVESFHAFLAQPPETATQQYVEPVRTVVAVLEARVARATVDVKPSGIKGVVVRIDGVEAPPASGPRMLDPGHHDFAASAPGFYDAYRTTSLPEGSRTTVELDLLPFPARPQNPALAVALAATGGALLVGGGIALGVGASKGLHSQPRSDAAPIMLGGGIAEGAGAVVLGAAAVWLLTRGQTKPPKTAVMPWASGRAAGVVVKF